MKTKIGEPQLIDFYSIVNLLGEFSSALISSNGHLFNLALFKFIRLGTARSQSVMKPRNISFFIVKYLFPYSINYQTIWVLPPAPGVNSLHCTSIAFLSYENIMNNKEIRKQIFVCFPMFRFNIAVLERKILSWFQIQFQHFTHLRVKRGWYFHNSCSLFMQKYWPNIGSFISMSL